ncbi:hypothetical protein EW146_g4774 [Bondarzewia mesenterica]|uniref:Transcription factor IIIC 90kDa subunit N-terminal domain-containing protein n=1 Tax=Bondarzewia mesenterica TaxID=1095465 RepID=A0A4S4LTG9_9AGAM|nr:hypothetical protein EW146_g4774 [Bondarzewia mesenterica]
MAHVTVYTALNVPTAASQPSTGCLQWTADGQILFVTKTAIYILTPDSGINFDASSTIKAPQITDSDVIKPIAWYRTMIEYDRTIICHWPADSQEWGAVALGSLDLSLRSVTASPSDLTDNAGCVLAVLNSNLELSIWAALKNPLKGKWLQDTAPFLKSLAAIGTGSIVQRTLQAQVTCAAWSTQTDFGITPSPHCDGSILAVGTRAGSIILLRFQEARSECLEHIDTISVTEQWITTMAWSSWCSVDSRICSVYLACGLSDGSILKLQVIESLILDSTAAVLAPCFQIETKTCISVDSPSDVDKRSITGMLWVEPRSREPVLVYCKPGIVHLWSKNSGDGSWSGSRTFILRTQRTSNAASSLHPATGIQYYECHDILVLSLFDGSFHVIYDISSEPTLQAQVDKVVPGLRSWDLSSISRSVYVQTEGKATTEIDMNRISGMVSYDNMSTVAWVHEGFCPSDFSYKHEAKHNSMFIVTEMWTGPQDDALMQIILKTIDSANAASGSAPIALLRPLFFHLQNRGRLYELQPRILEILRNTPVNEPHSFLDPVTSDQLTDDARKSIRRSLTQHLFGYNSLLSLRLRLAVADFCWKNAASPQAQAECGAVAQGLLNTISHRNLSTFVMHLRACAALLTQKDMPFLLRVVLQSLLPGTPSDLSAEAQELSNLINTMIPPVPDAQGASFGLEESCPACGVVVALENISSACCSNGHVWARCSVTSFILSTPMVRTCLGCARKAFLPPGHRTAAERPPWLPPIAQSWVVEELLEAYTSYVSGGKGPFGDVIAVTPPRSAAEYYLAAA